MKLNYTQDAVLLLQKLIRIPSFSREESKTAEILTAYFEKNEIQVQRHGNNIVATNQTRDKSKPLVVLNSHHDTVKVTKGWTKDPFGAEEERGRLYGLGSNDAGGSLVSMIQAFKHFYHDKKLPFQLMFIASAEEEVFGSHGLALVLPQLDQNPDLAIVGEPTNMQMAIAEKGLMVVDAIAYGKAGHVANGAVTENAIYKALTDIDWLNNYEFERTSPVLGSVAKAVTQIEAGYQHNIVPDQCKFVIDLRINEAYNNQEIISILRDNCRSELKPRSMRWQASGIEMSHPLVKNGIELGLKYYGSSTLSDQVHFTCPSLKIGCGKSERSHTADEFIEIQEIAHGIETYIQLLSSLKI